MLRSHLTIMTVVCICLSGCAAPAPEGASLLKPDTGETIGSANGTKPMRPIMPETFVASGRFLEGRGDMAGAIEQYQKAIDADSRFADAYNCLGVAYQTLGQMHHARRAFDDGIRAAPNSATLRNNAGLCHAMQERDEEAENHFRDALEIDPDFHKARGNLAILLARNDRLGESFQEFKQIVSSVEAYTNIGIILLEQGRHDSAMDIFRQALEIEPANQAAADGLEKATAASELAEPPEVADAAAPPAEPEVMDTPTAPPEPAAVSTGPVPSVVPVGEEADQGIQVGLRGEIGDRVARVQLPSVLESASVDATPPEEQPIKIESIFSDDPNIVPPNHRVILASIDRPVAFDRSVQVEPDRSRAVPTIPSWPSLTLAAMGLAAFVTYVSPGTRERTSGA